MSALVVAMLLTAGLDPKDPLYASCPDGPVTEQVQQTTDLSARIGWLLLHPERAQRVACLLETCDAARKETAKLLETPPSWWALITGAFSLGIALGAGLGFLFK